MLAQVFTFQKDITKPAMNSCDSFQGFVKSHQALAVCRAILGFCGAGKTVTRLTIFAALNVE